MNWELDRHNWAELGAEGARLPALIAELVNTDDPARANELMSLIESIVVPVNGPLKVGAAAVAACLTQGLLSATPVSRAEILFLVFQLAGGVIGAVDSDLAGDVRREVELGLPIFAEIAETGTRAERLQCVDVLAFCARFNEPCLVRSISVMRRIAELGDDEASAVAVELEDLANDGFVL